MDSDHSKEIDFEEYIISMYNFCSMEKDNLSAFVFQLFDVDDSGKLSKAEIVFLIQLVYGFVKNQNVEGWLSSLPFDINGDLSLIEFCSSVKHANSVLFPVFEFQYLLRRDCLGERYSSAVL